MTELLKWLGSISAEDFGKFAATAAAAFFSALFTRIPFKNLKGFLKKDKELDALDDREKETAHSKALWKRDVEILELRRELDRSERRAELLESHCAVLEERIAQLRVERATGKHARPPAIPDVTAHAKSDPPRSGSKPLPPLPTTVKPTRPLGK